MFRSVFRHQFSVRGSVPDRDSVPSGRAHVASAAGNGQIVCSAPNIMQSIASASGREALDLGQHVARVPTPT
jgi:hypothetical protein